MNRRVILRPLAATAVAIHRSRSFFAALLHEHSSRMRVGALVLALLLAVAWGMPARAAIAYRAVSTNTTTTKAATSLSITKPTGTTTDDVMIASLSVRGGTGATMGAPAGWVQIRQDYSSTSIELTTYYKVVTASESSTTSYSFTFGSTSRLAAGAIVTYSGVDTTNPINASGGQANASGTTMTSPTITTTKANAYVLALFAAATNTAATQAAGLTERYDVHSTNTTAANNAVAEGSDVLQAAAGATGTKTATITTAAVNLGQTIALSPSFSVSQTSYHWYANQDSVQPGASLANESTSLVTKNPSSLRLRMGLTLDSSDSLAAGSKSFKLQYAASSSGPWSDVSNPGATAFPDTRITDPSPQPYGTGYAEAFSPDGTYLATGDNTIGVYFAVYKRSGDAFTQLTVPIPSSSPEDMAWSPDGNYLTLVIDSSPYILTYKRSGDTFTALPAPATLPAGSPYSVSYTSTADGVYLAVAHATTPFVTIYKQSGDTLTKLANPASLPAGNGFSADFSSDGTYLAIGHATTPFMTIYKRSGDTFTKLSNPASLPAQVSYGIAFSPDTNYLALSIATSPYIAVYSRSGDTFTKLSNPDVLPTAAGEDIAWSPDGNHLTVAEDNSPYIITYDRSGSTFTKRADPASLPADSGESLSYSSDGTYLAVRTLSNASDPSLIIYKAQPSVWSYLDNPTPANGATISSALLSGTPVLESYNEANPTVTNPNAIAGGQMGEWDFPLSGGGVTSGSTYYFRMTEGDGTLLKTYSTYPQVTVDNSQLNEASYRLFTNQDGSSSPGGALSFAAKVDYPANMYSAAAIAADFNKDGKQDMAVASGSSNNVSILLNNGSGSFNAKVDYTTGSDTDTLVAADFNGDGNLDLAATNYSSASVSVLLGTGTGTFGAKTDYTVGSNPKYIVAGDFNGDGKIDLANSNSSANTVSVLLGTGTGSFGTKTDFVTNSGPQGLATADFNGDGKLDLAVSTNTNSTVSVLLGTGTGSFGTKTDYTVGGGPEDVGAADFNGDGKLDLVTANNTANTVSVLLGTGSGTFGTKTDFTAGSGPSNTTIADFNGDGKPDLASANINGGNVSIFPGNGTGGFGTRTDVATNSMPEPTGVGDFNGDGKPDLAVPDYIAGFVSVLMNTTAFPASIDVGAPLANLNTAATMGTYGTPFRLRLNIGVTNGGTTAGAKNLKLQYAQKAGTCLATPAASYVNVTDTTSMQYYDNPIATNGTAFATNVNDPTDGSNALIRQTYQEKGTTSFANTGAIGDGQDGMWDFALTSTAGANNAAYCFRVVNSDGSSLDTYTQIPEITIGTLVVGPTLDQQVRGGQSVLNGVKSGFSF